MECPYCKASLVHWDKFGRLASHQDGKVQGDILICPTDTCNNPCENTFHQYHGKEEIKEGMPC